MRTRLICGARDDDDILLSLQSATSFQVTVRDEDWIVAALEPSDLQENATAYAARVTGQPQRTQLVQYQNLSDPAPLVFNASHRGMCYTVGLLVKEGKAWSKPVKIVAILTSMEHFTGPKDI